MSTTDQAHRDAVAHLLVPGQSPELDARVARLLDDVQVARAAVALYEGAPGSAGGYARELRSVLDATQQDLALVRAAFDTAGSTTFDEVQAAMQHLAKSSMGDRPDPLHELDDRSLGSTMSGSSGIESVVQLRDGSSISIRPISPADASDLMEFHEGLSADSTRLRFFSPHPRLSAREVAYFTSVDHQLREALVARHEGNIVGIGRYDGAAESRDAEIAFVVADSWHRRGVATLLLSEVATRARAAGFRSLVAETLAENHPMIDVFEHAGLPLTRTFDGITTHFVLSLVETSETTDPIRPGPSR